MEKIYAAIRDLTEYALATELIAEEDVIYTVNSLLGALGIDDYPGDRAEIIGGAAARDREKIADGTLLEGILAVILDHAAEKGMIDGASVVMRDLFDTKIMGILTPRPSEVIAKFRGIYNEDPVRATDWYYDFSRNTDYIRIFTSYSIRKSCCCIVVQIRKKANFKFVKFFWKFIGFCGIMCYFKPVVKPLYGSNCSTG